MKTVIYQPGSETIRQMPESYCLANKKNGYWLLDFDPACNKRIAERILNLLFNFDIMYGSGENLIKEYKKKFKIPIR